MGGSGAGSWRENVIGQFVNLPVETIFDSGAEAQPGMMPMVEQLAKKYGFDLSGMLAKLPSETTPAVPAPTVAAESKGDAGIAGTKYLTVRSTIKSSFKV